MEINVSSALRESLRLQIDLLKNLLKKSVIFLCQKSNYVPQCLLIDILGTVRVFGYGDNSDFIAVFS